MMAELEPNCHSGTSNHGPRYKGPASEVFNLVLRTIVGPVKINYTTIMKESMGYLDPSTGYFDKGSCLYSMQINESDASTTTTYHPLMGKHLKPLQPYVEEDFFILSRYNVSREVYHADVMDAFAYAFSPEIWCLCVLFTFVFWLLFKFYIRVVNQTRRRRDRIRDESMYKVLLQFFGMESIAFNQLTCRMTSFLLTLISFYILTYFTILMKTESVIVPEPKVINSYNDLLAKPRLQMIFFRIIDNFDLFENAEPHTIERKLWQKSLKEVGGDREKMIIKVGRTEEMMSYFARAQNSIFDSRMETVAILSNTVKGPIRILGCQGKVMALRDMTHQERSNSGIQNLFTWISKDPASKNYMLSGVRSDHQTSSFATKKIRRASLAYSMGLTQMMQKKLNEVRFGFIKTTNQFDGDTFRDCLAENYRDNMLHVLPKSLSPIQFRKLSYTFAGLVCLAFICSRFERRKKRKESLMRWKKEVKKIIHGHRPK